MAGGGRLGLEFFDDAMGDQAWGAENYLAGFDAEWRARLRIDRVHQDRAGGLGDSVGEAVWAGARGERLLQLADEPAVSFRPGDDGLGTGVAGDSAARGEIMNAGPRGNFVRVRAEIIAAAIIDIPAQRLRVPAVRVHEFSHRLLIECREVGIARAFIDWNDEGAFAVGAARVAISVHQSGEGVVLTFVFAGNARRGEQTFLPCAVDEEAFHWLGAKIEFVVDGA